MRHDGNDGDDFTMIEAVSESCKCGWRVFSHKPATVSCPKCRGVVHFAGGATGKAPKRPAKLVPHAPSHWPPLHRYAAKHIADWNAAEAVKFYDKWCLGIPNIGCACMANWRAYVAANPPDFSSARAFALWGFTAHNYVSANHAKRPVMGVETCWLTYWPKPRGYCDEHFVAVTSLAPRECGRQTAALSSWVDFGLTIHAVNTPAEIEILRPLYPQVAEWHASHEQTTGLSKPTATINSLLDIAVKLNKTILLINSDCEMYGDPKPVIESSHLDALTIGVRNNYLGEYYAAPVREEWGLDAFVVKPEMVEGVPRLNFGIGSPVWDYWLPLHFQRAGVPIRVIEEQLIYHKSHNLAWSREDWLKGVDVILAHYNYPMFQESTQLRESLPDRKKRV